jgi:hypothetical protein
MKICPVTLRQAQDFVRQHHRHNKPPRGAKFAIGLRADDGRLLGVAVAGRPVARAFAGALEVTRTCTDGTPNANSMLYGAVRRAACAMGYERIYTYTQHDESGASLRAAGFFRDAELKPRKNWAESSGPAHRKTRDMSEPSGVARVRWTWPAPTAQNTTAPDALCTPGAVTTQKAEE